MTQPYGNYQIEIYFQGLTGTVPSLPISFDELEARAAQALPSSVWSYVAGGAGDERTQRVNVSAFEQWGLMPRMLVGATERDLSVELWGTALARPPGVHGADWGGHRAVHPRPPRRPRRRAGCRPHRGCRCVCLR